MTLKGLGGVLRLLDSDDVELFLASHSINEIDLRERWILAEILRRAEEFD